jgi:hypothetical protein
MIFYVFLSVVHDVPLNCLAALTPLLTEAYEESFKQRILLGQGIEHLRVQQSGCDYLTYKRAFSALQSHSIRSKTAQANRGFRTC